jgi:hypothetical protein
MLLVSLADELKGIDTKDGCRIISDEHFGHLLIVVLESIFNPEL